MFTNKAERLCSTLGLLLSASCLSGCAVDSPAQTETVDSTTQAYIPWFTRGSLTEKVLKGSTITVCMKNEVQCVDSSGAPSDCSQAGATALPAKMTDATRPVLEEWTRTYIMAWVDAMRKVSGVPLIDASDIVFDCSNPTKVDLNEVWLTSCANANAPVAWQGNIRDCGEDWYASPSLLHELGHTFGMNDTYDGGAGVCVPGQPLSVMCASFTKHLMDDDIAGIQHLFSTVFPWAKSNGKASITETVVTPADASWKVVGAGDVEGGGKADLAWRRQSDEGEVRFWLLDGAGGLKQDVGMTSLAAAGWKVVGVGDFDGDKLADLAWRRQSDEGEVRFWLLDGAGGLKQDIGMTSLAAAGWKVVGVGDFDGDKLADLAWRRQNDEGEVRFWLLNGAGGLKRDLPLSTIADPGWKVVGVGDFDGNGLADLAWRRQSDQGEVRIWNLAW